MPTEDEDARELGQTLGDVERQSAHITPEYLGHGLAEVMAALGRPVDIELFCDHAGGEDGDGLA